MRIYTRTGDDGTTALLGGARVRKDDLVIEVNGALDEAQALLGSARAECEKGDDLDTLLVSIERDLWIVMGELATGPGASDALRAATPVTTEAMVVSLEERIDEVTSTLSLERGFAVPGDNRLSAALDVARTVVRRAERAASGLSLGPSPALAYLNRLSDLCWALARSVEGVHVVQHRPVDVQPPRAPADPEKTA